MERTRKMTGATAKAIVAAALIAALGTYSLGLQAHAQDKKKQPAAMDQQVSHARALSQSFRDVYKAVAASVVNIRSTERLGAARPTENDGQLQQEPDNPLEDPLRRFFGEEGSPFRFGPTTPMPRERIGEGTGVIAREDGYVVTNNHVVEGADTIRVKLDDEREYDGSVVGTDPETDLAVVKIEASGLSPAKFGDSSQMEVGDWVLALGSPFGLQHTVTAGIVSAKGRQIGIIRDARGFTGFEDFLQTDAAINPGNSGGPLVNLDGEVIGINTAISTQTGQYAGVGFAIPSNMVKDVMTSIINNGKVERGWLGVQIGALTKEAAEYAKFDGQGVLISDVLPNGPALAAGLEPGDIVTKVNGKHVSTPAELLNVVAGIAPGKDVTLEVYREGKTHDYSVTLGDRAAAQSAQGGRAPNARGERQPAGDFGITVEDITPELARRLGATGRDGVLVTKVTADSPAAQAGVEPGDIVSMINETKVSNSREFAAAIKGADKSKVIRLQVFHQDVTQFLYIKPDSKK